LTISIEEERTYKIHVGGVTVTVTEGELVELYQKLRSILGSKVKRGELKLTVPSGIPKDLSPIAQAMLAVCRKYHKGYQNKAYAGVIADEIAKEYPVVAALYENRRKLVYATIFPGKMLVERGLLKMEKDKDGYRQYWSP